MSGHAKALAAILFITIASATSFYPNSTSLQGTSSSESVSTTSSQSASLSDSITATFLLTATSSSDTSWTSSCLYDPGLGYGNCNRPGDPVHEIYINPYDTSSFPSVFLGTPSLANLCSEMFVSDYNQFLGTGVITTTAYPGYTAYPDGPSSALYSPVIDTSEVLNVYYIDTWTYTAEPPCCLGCTLFGGSVQVYYWPTPASSPSVSTLVNSAGFTFISPSVYVAFESLQAVDLCGNVGPIYNSTTIGFNDGELSTAMAWTYSSDNYQPFAPWPPQTFSMATWGDETNCENITTSFWQGYGPEIYSDYPEASSAVGTSDPILYDDLYLFTITYNPCSPTLSVPTELFTINSLWTSCYQGIDAFYDPPYALTKGNGLAAFSPTADPTESAGPPVTTAVHPAASPASTPKPGTVDPTTTPIVIPTSTIANEPPAQSPPGAGDSDPTTSAEADPPPASTANNDSPSQSPNPGAKAPPSSLPYGNDPSAESPSSTGNDPAQQSPTPNSAAIATIGGSTLTANSASAFVYGTQTLTPGGQATISGITYYLAPNGDTLVIGARTTQPLAFTTPSPSPSPTQYLVGTQTLIAGAPAITVSGTTFSLLPGASSVVVNGNTQAASILISSAEYLVGTQTLKAGGPAITVSGTEISLMSGGSSVVVDGTTEALTALLGAATPTGNPSATTTPEEGLGGIIASVGGFATPVTTNEGTAAGGGFNGTVFPSGSNSMKGSRSDWVMGWMLGIVAAGLLIL